LAELTPTHSAPRYCSGTSSSRSACPTYHRFVQAPKEIFFDPASNSCVYQHTDDSRYSLLAVWITDMVLLTGMMVGVMRLRQPGKLWDFIWKQASNRRGLLNMACRLFSLRAGSGLDSDCNGHASAYRGMFLSESSQRRSSDSDAYQIFPILNLNGKFYSQHDG
jgi:hypothetical protein